MIRGQHIILKGLICALLNLPNMYRCAFPTLLLYLLLLCLTAFQPVAAYGQQKAAFKAHFKGTQLYQRQQYSRAVQQFEKAHQLLPGNYQFAVSLALGLSQVGKNTAGLRLLQESNALLHSSAPGYTQQLAYRSFIKGIILANGERFDDAIAPFRESIALQQQIGEPKLLALFHNALGHAMMLNQGSSWHGSDTLGWHYHVHRRDLLRALPEFDRALQYDPGNTAALHNYSLLRNALGMETLRDFYQNRDSLPPLPDTPLPNNTKRTLQFAAYDELLFLLDISGSMVMENVACMGTTRFKVMKETALFVLDSLPPSTQIGLGTIDGDCGTEPVAWEAVGILSHYDMRYRLRFLAPNGTTPLLERLQASPELFPPGDSTRKAIFLISDGANICRSGGSSICQWAAQLADRNITINVLTFLDAQGGDSNAFAEYGCLAANTGGQILYLDNYRCSYEYFGSDMLTQYLPKIPELRRVQCWGPAVKGLWAVIRQE